MNRTQNSILPKKFKDFLSKIPPFFKKHAKPIGAFAFAITVAFVVYTDLFGLGDPSPKSDYLYNAEYNESTTKILGEATLVDSLGAEENAMEDSFFAMATVNKERSRDEAIQTLQSVVESAENDEETRNLALHEIMDIASYIETEVLIEEMIKSKGFEDCVAIISGGKVNVIVKSDGLLTSEIAQITDIVKTETGLSAEDIRIVEKI